MMTNRFRTWLITAAICLLHYSPAFAQTGKVVLRTRAAVTAVAYSPDGKILAAVYRDTTIKLWDAHTHKLLAILQNDKYHVMSLAFSPDGKTLATGGKKFATLWDVSTGKPKAKLKGHNRYVSAVAFSPDGRTLATGGDEDRQIRLWDVKDGKVKYTFPLPSNSQSAKSLTFSPDGQTLAVASEGRVQLWDLARRKKKGLLFGDAECIAFSLDGKTLALGSSGGASLRDARTGKPIGTIGEPGKRGSAAFSPNRKLLAIAEKSLEIWDLKKGEKVRSLKGKGSPYNAVAFSPDGKSLACGGYNGLLELWNYENKQQIAVLNDNKIVAHGQIRHTAVSPDGKSVAVMLQTAGIGADSRTYLVDVDTGEVKVHISQPSSAQHVISRDAKFLACPSKDNIQLWDVQTGKQLRTINTPYERYNALTFSPDGSTLAARVGISLFDEKVLLLDVKSGKEIGSFRPLGEKGGFGGPGGFRIGGTRVLQFGSDGKLLATGWPQLLGIWDVSAKKKTTSFSPNKTGTFDKAAKAALSSDLKVMAVANTDGTIEIWDVRSSKKIATLDNKTAEDRVSQRHSLAFSPDGRFLAFGAADTTIRLWDVRKQKQIAKLEGHTAAITSLAFIHDGNTLVSGSADHTVRFWDVSMHAK